MLENLKRLEAVLPTIDRGRTLEMLLELQTLYFGDDDAVIKYGDIAYWNELSRGQLTCCRRCIDSSSDSDVATASASVPHPPAGHDDRNDDSDNGKMLVEDDNLLNRNNAELLEKITTRGYHVLPPPTVGGSKQRKYSSCAFTSTIKALADAGWPPQFLLMYDETWELVKDVVRQIIIGDDVTVESDVNIWSLRKDYAPPASGSSSSSYYIGGNFIRPHRDMIFDACHDDDTENPTSLSVWIPLNPSGATERNGCMRCLPIENDDFFYSPKHPRHSDNGNYTDEDATRLIVEQFGCAVWDPCCVHWGGSYEYDDSETTTSTTTRCEEEPRSSLAFTIRLGSKAADFGTTASTDDTASRIPPAPASAGDAGRGHGSLGEAQDETGPAACSAAICDGGGPKRRLQVVAKSLLSYSHHWPGFPFPGFRENLQRKEKYCPSRREPGRAVEDEQAKECKVVTIKRSDNLNSLMKYAVKKNNVQRKDDPLALDELLAQTAQTLLESLYEEYTFATAKDASLTDDVRFEEHASHHKHTENSLVYGEIDIEGFCDLLINDIPHDSHDVFYDLGSGSGRAVMAARFVGDFRECIGIELLGNLHELASSVKSLYKFQYSQKLIHRNVRFVCSDLLDYEWWKDGTVVYVPNLLFDETLKLQITEKAMELRPGAYLICLKKFNGAAFNCAFELIKERPVAMSWGESNVYIYQRQT